MFCRYWATLGLPQSNHPRPIADRSRKPSFPHLTASNSRSGSGISEPCSKTTQCFYCNVLNPVLPPHHYHRHGHCPVDPESSSIGPLDPWTLGPSMSRGRCFRSSPLATRIRWSAMMEKLKRVCIAARETAHCESAHDIPGSCQGSKRVQPLTLPPFETSTWANLLDEHHFSRWSASPSAPTRGDLDNDGVGGVEMG